MVNPEKLINKSLLNIIDVDVDEQEEIIAKNLLQLESPKIQKSATLSLKVDLSISDDENE